jgi:SAM-dependent methyltransferase
VGCGEGHWTALLARRGAAVVGVDVSEPRLARALRRRSSASFLRMDAEELEFADASFDKAVSFCVVEHFQRDERVLAHLARVVRPGGGLFLSADSLSNPGISDAERLTHRRRYAAFNLYTRESLGEKLDRAGFELEETRYILTTPLSLGLARFSWRLDDLQPSAPALTALGNLLLSTVGRVTSELAERVAAQPDAGLTLLARARRR